MRKRSEMKPGRLETILKGKQGVRAMDSDASTVLSSWKDIARYLGKGVRTVQRWERDLGLPVRRPIGAAQKSAVVLHRGDVDAWLATRFAARAIARESVQSRHGRRESLRAELKAQMELAQKLRETHLALTQQIADAITKVVEKCDLLSSQASQFAGAPPRRFLCSWRRWQGAW